MGRHGKSRSRSRSKSGRREKYKSDRDRHDRDRRQSSRDRRDRHESSRRRSRSRSRSIDRSQRRSKFDIDPSGRDQRAPKQNRWSDKPPDATQNVYDPSAAKLEAQNLINAITINPEIQNAQNELVNKQSELFQNLLKEARFEQKSNARVETIRPQMNMDPFKSAFGKEFGATSLVNALNDTSKIKRKIYIPRDANFNFTGLIIGPKGANQKRLEEETGCKILVRGKGSQKEGAPPQPDDDEDLHVLIIGDNEFQLAKATAEIERIIFADEETRVKIRQEQLRLVAQLKNDAGALLNKGLAGPNGEPDMSMTTPYGPPSEDAFVIRVPNDCVGLVIGKSGETIRQLQMQSGAKKVQVAAESNKGADYRNLFVEGDREAYDIVQQMVKDIVDQQRKIKQSMTGLLPDNTQGVRDEVPVPDNLVGLIIGRGGETVKSINQRTGAVIFIPKECDPNNSNERILIVSGTDEQVAQAKQEIHEKVQEGLRNMQLKALQAQGVPIQLITSLGLTDPMMLQQYLASFDPAYAAMYQHMYAQQPVVTTVADSSTLPGSQTNYQNQNYNQMMPNYGMMPDYTANYQNQGMQMSGVQGGQAQNMQDMQAMPGMQGMQPMQGFPNQPMQGAPGDYTAQMAYYQQNQALPQQHQQQPNGDGQ